MPALEESWTQVGRKGKAKRSKKPAEGSAVLSSATPEGVKACASVASALPGWYRQETTQRKPQGKTRSPAESQVAAVLAAKQEVAASVFYGSLLRCLRAAAEAWCQARSPTDKCPEPQPEAIQSSDMDNLVGATAKLNLDTTGKPDSLPAEPVHGEPASGCVPDHAKTPSVSATDSQQDILVSHNMPGSSAEPIGSPPMMQCGEHGAWRWPEVEHLVVYGLGSLEAPGSGRTARFQLALALLLLEQLPPDSTIHAYDPVFTATDIQVLQQLGCQVMTTNDNGRHPLTGCTLLYMPHCGLELTNNVLDAHWRTLHQLALLGNSFKAYDEYWASADYARRHGNKQPARMLSAVSSGRVLELPVPDGGFHVVSAFNNTSVHMFK